MTTPLKRPRRYRRPPPARRPIFTKTYSWHTVVVKVWLPD